MHRGAAMTAAAAGSGALHCEGQTCRPATERSSFTLPVSVGCSYNRCKFCTFFKHLRYRVLPLDLIEAELQRVRDLGGNPEKVFLGNGNAFGLETARLEHIAVLIGHYFPKCRMINMDATVTDIRNKTDAELRRLHMVGIRRLYLGIESGLDDVLTAMHKDHDTEQAYRQIRRIQDAEFIYNAHIMTGVAGKDRGLENADALVEFFNRTRPERITNFSLFLHKSAPLYQDILDGTFTPADELENLREAYRLVERLQSDALFYDGFHDHIGLRVWGTLPQERRAMLRKLEQAIAAHSRHKPVVAYTA